MSSESGRNGCNSPIDVAEEKITKVEPVPVSVPVVERDRSPVESKKTCRFFVTNLPPSMTRNEFKAHICTTVGVPSYIRVYRDSDGVPLGTANVEYEDVELAKKFMNSMNNCLLMGHRVYVKDDWGTKRDRYGNVMQPENLIPSLLKTPVPVVAPIPASLPTNTICYKPPSNRDQTFGLNEQFLKTLGITGPLVSRVLVRNLSPKVKNQKLREVFSLAGKVIHAETYYDAAGKHRGLGTVEYDHPLEAVQAISMFNNQKLYSLNLVVILDNALAQFESILPEGLESIGPGLGVRGESLHSCSISKISQTLAQDVDSAKVATPGKNNQLGTLMQARRRPHMTHNFYNNYHFQM